MKKVVFLDVDGVLNSVDDFSSTSPGEISKMTCEVFDRPLRLLKQIIDETDATVVISSSWRLTLSRKEEFSIKKLSLYDKLILKLNEYRIVPIGITPIFEGEKRGDEIRAWLKIHPDIINFVILDDDNDMCEFTKTNLVQTTYEYGLREEHVKKAIEILNS